VTEFQYSVLNGGTYGAFTSEVRTIIMLVCIF